jgi:uncharacterized protein (TIGR02145 family)
MKRVFTILTALLLTVTLWAQSPEKMSYQAVIRDSGNKLVQNKAVGMKISILKGSESGSVVYTENQTPTTNANGLVSIEFGGGANFNSIDWSKDSYFIQTETDPTGEKNYTISGISQLLSVPYAFYANTVGNGFSGNFNDLQNKPSILDTLKKLTLDAGSLTIYNVADPINNQDAATKAYVDKLQVKISFLESMLSFVSGESNSYITSDSSGKVKDIEGNIYKTIKIGTQWWMGENLNTSHYRNKDTIPNITDNATWIALTSGAYCNYNNDAKNAITYGKLYNWYVVNDSRNVCPAGWHVPSNEEMQVLADYLGGTSLAGGKMKEIGTTHWQSPNTGATNQTNFTGLPAGARYLLQGDFSGIGSNANGWTTTIFNSNGAYNWELVCNQKNLFLYSATNNFAGNSVRCLKD